MVDYLKEATGLSVCNYDFDVQKLLHLKYHIGNTSYRMLERIGQGMCSATDGFVRFPSRYETSKQKNSLPIGKFSIFHSPYGKTTGRYWEFLNMLETKFMDREKMVHFEPILVDGE